MMVGKRSFLKVLQKSLKRKAYLVTNLKKSFISKKICFFSEADFFFYTTNQDFNDFISITNRYFTSALMMRSYAWLMFCMVIISMSDTILCSPQKSSIS